MAEYVVPSPRAKRVWRLVDAWLRSNPMRRSDLESRILDLLAGTDTAAEARGWEAERAVCGRVIATAQALLDKMAALDRRVNSVFALAANHGVRWPEGDEHSWAAERDALADALREAHVVSSLRVELRQRYENDARFYYLVHFLAGLPESEVFDAVVVADALRDQLRTRPTAPARREEG